MVINPIVGVYIPIMRILFKGGMTIPNKTRLLTMEWMTIFSSKWGAKGGNKVGVVRTAPTSDSYLRHQLTPQKFNMSMRRMAIFKRSHLFQAIILGIQAIIVAPFFLEKKLPWGHRKDVRVYLDPPEQPPDALNLGEEPGGAVGWNVCPP